MVMAMVMAVALQGQRSKWRNVRYLWVAAVLQLFERGVVFGPKARLGNRSIGGFAWS